MINDDFLDPTADVDENDPQKNIINIEDSDIADNLMYDSSRDIKFLYVARLKIFEEFGTSNEGFILFDPDENILNFSMTRATAAITGAVNSPNGVINGPNLRFELDLDTNKIINKELTPTPDSGEYNRPQFATHSNEIIDISDERIIEIGNYFKELMISFE